MKVYQTLCSKSSDVYDNDVGWFGPHTRHWWAPNRAKRVWWLGTVCLTSFQIYLPIFRAHVIWVSFLCDVDTVAGINFHILYLWKLNHKSYELNHSGSIDWVNLLRPELLLQLVKMFSFSMSLKSFNSIVRIYIYSQVGSNSRILLKFRFLRKQRFYFLPIQVYSIHLYM